MNSASVKCFFIFKYLLILLAFLPVLVSCGKKDEARSVLVDKRVLMLGNSITQNGAYVSFIEYYLRKKYPESSIDIISIGLSSETVSCLTEKGHPYPRPCLTERLERALEKIRPEVVVACYGMNDGIYHPQSPERLDRFQQGIRSLLQRVEQANASAVLLTPPVFDALPIAAKVVESTPEGFGYARPYKGYDSVLADYSQWLTGIEKPGVRVVDLHSPMKAHITEKRLTEPTFTFASDGVHPSPSGHLFMAQQFLENLGFSFTGDLASDYENILADSLFQLVDERRKLRSEGWLRYVGYIKEDTVSHPSIEATELSAARLEQEIAAIHPHH